MGGPDKGSPDKGSGALHGGADWAQQRDRVSQLLYERGPKDRGRRSKPVCAKTPFFLDPSCFLCGKFFFVVLHDFVEGPAFTIFVGQKKKRSSSLKFPSLRRRGFSVLID